MNNTIPNVPRELLERVLNAGWGSETVNALDDLRDFLESASSSANHVEDVRAMVADPSPAGVDGLNTDRNAAFKACPESGCDWGSFYLGWKARGEVEQAIIDGLRGDLAVALKVPSVAAMRAYLDTEFAKDNMRLGTERDQQAQRIGELEGLLLRVQVSLSLDDTEWGYSGAEKYKLLADIRAAMSAGKDSEQ